MAAKAKPFGECKLCRQQREPCESHIVPEFCHTSIYDHKHRASAIYTDKNRWRQQGYKEPLLCADCEERLNTNYEQPFHKFWYGNVLTTASAMHEYVMVRGFQYDWIKLFHLSVLWRCHVSEQFGNTTPLGHYGDVIRRMLLDGTPGAEDYLTVAGCMLLDDNRYVMDQFVSYPMADTDEESSFYVMQYAGCEWYFLMASTMNPKLTQFKLHSIHADGSVLLMTKPYQRSYGFGEAGKTQRARNGRR